MGKTGRIITGTVAGLAVTAAIATPLATQTSAAEMPAPAGEMPLPHVITPYTAIGVGGTPHGKSHKKAGGSIAGEPTAETQAVSVSLLAAGVAPFSGQTLTVGPSSVCTSNCSSNGDWTNCGTAPAYSSCTFTYQWQQCNSTGTGCVNIPAATGQTYSVSPSDVGHTLVVTVTATNTGGSASQATPATGVVTAGGASLSIAVNNATGQLVGANGSQMQLYGVDVTGTEDACIENAGFGWMSLDQTNANNLKSWGVNAVRVPLNEDCWLGVNMPSNSVASGYSGTGYQNAIETWVSALNTAGIIAVLDLHWAAPSTFHAYAQWPQADTDHSLTFWTQVANSFKADPAVAFDLYNEPYPGNNGAANSTDYGCWLNGCTNYTANVDTMGTTINGLSYTPGTTSYTTAGMQAMINTIRATGARQPIFLEDANWGDDPCNQTTSPCPVFAHWPTDSANQLVLSVHAYNGHGCTTVACWNYYLSQAQSRKIPIVAGEIGNLNGATGTSSYTGQYMSWAITNDVGFMGWAWYGGGSLALVSSPSGTNTGNGATVQADVRAGIAANG